MNITRQGTSRPCAGHGTRTPPGPRGLPSCAMTRTRRYDAPLRHPDRPTDSAPLGAAVGPDRHRPPTGASRVAHPPLSMPDAATPPAQPGGCSCRSLPLPTAAFSLSRWERLAHSLLSGPARRSRRVTACRLAESLADCRTLRLLRCLHGRCDGDRLERHLPGGNRTRREGVPLHGTPGPPRSQGRQPERHSQTMSRREIPSRPPELRA